MKLSNDLPESQGTTSNVRTRTHRHNGTLHARTIPRSRVARPGGRRSGRAAPVAEVKAVRVAAAREVARAVSALAMVRRAAVAAELAAVVTATAVAAAASAAAATATVERRRCGCARQGNRALDASQPQSKQPACIQDSESHHASQDRWRVTCAAG